MSDLSVKEGLDAMDVASYLRKHPDFLAEFPDLALALQDMWQGSVPGLAIGSVQLHVQHVLVALPRLVEEERVCVVGIAV